MFANEASKNESYLTYKSSQEFVFGNVTYRIPVYLFKTIICIPTVLRYHSTIFDPLSLLLSLGH